MYQKIGNALNYSAMLLFAAFGFIYLFKSSFMPYHSEAVELAWSSVDSKIQVLILALMRALSGGYFTAAVALFLLQRKFCSTKASWIPGLILGIELPVILTSMYATVFVRLNSNGNPPVLLTIIGLLLIIFAYFFNRKSLQTS